MDLPLTLVGITLLSAEEAHRFLVVDVLRTIHDFHHCLQRADRVLAKRNLPANFSQIALLGISRFAWLGVECFRRFVSQVLRGRGV